MNFGDKLKQLRKDAGLSQEDLARQLNITQKSICNYENNTRFPKGQKIITGLAEIFNVSVDYLISDNDDVSRNENFISNAKTKFGYKGKKEAEMILDRTSAIFAGGELSEDDKDAFFKSITEIYFDAKHKARKKYGRKTTEDKDSHKTP